ncbi:MAG: polysaccharide pyruvyl transferase CsaB [Cyanobium sp.]
MLLCGYYGEHNLGDDALLQVLLQQLPPGWQPLVTAHDQALVQQAFGVETVDRRRLAAVLAALGRCRALVLGGGSLLQDSTSFRSLLYYAALILAARRRGLPVLLWGQGLGPLRRRRSRLLVRCLLPLVNGITWRDPASAQLAAGWGLRAGVGSDPVWSLPPHRWQGCGGPIVLCWRPVAQLDARGWTTLLAAVDQLAERFQRPVHWLPFHRHQDRDLLQDLQRRGVMPASLLQRSHLVESADPEAAMAQFSGASLVIAMRLHGLILAALAGSPCAALSYDPKVAAAAAALPCPCLDLDGAISATAASELEQSWAALLDQAPDPEALSRLRQGGAVHAALLQQLPAAAQQQQPAAELQLPPSGR